MGNELKLNSAEEAEVVLIRLTPEEYPIAYANKVKCLMLSGLSKKEAERMAMEPIDLELYYEVGVGLMAVEPGAVGKCEELRFRGDGACFAWRKATVDEIVEHFKNR